MTPPLIALEEHFYSNAVFASIGEQFKRTLQAVPGLTGQLLDLGEDRLAAMDRGKISLQVISHAFTPGTSSFPMPLLLKMYATSTDTLPLPQAAPTPKTAAQATTS